MTGQGQGGAGIQTAVAEGGCAPLRGTLTFPGDKSLSHRAIFFGALAEGTSEYTNVLTGEDCVCTRRAFEAMGVPIESPEPGHVIVRGVGLAGLRAPEHELYLGNSGTSMRLLLGLLAGLPFEATLTGDPSLSSRPMRRVTEHLVRMGAVVEGRDGGNLAPLKIRGGKLRAIDVRLAVASAQVKSAILLAGLSAKGTTRVTEPALSRDHTERFLEYYGASVRREGLSVSLDGPSAMTARSFEIAGDISSAAFFIAAAALVPGSELGFRSVLWNPTRTGVMAVLERMGVRARIESVRQAGPEPVADFTVSHGPLTAFEIDPPELPALIDEVPILTVLATQARGTSVIRDADELRVKETDRIRSMTETLSAMGADIRADGNTILVKGPTPLRGARVRSHGDHRTAMSAIVAGLVAKGQTRVDDVACINTSFPGFFELLTRSGGSARRQEGGC